MELKGEEDLEEGEAKVFDAAASDVVGDEAGMNGKGGLCRHGNSKKDEGRFSFEGRGAVVEGGERRPEEDENEEGEGEEFGEGENGARRKVGRRPEGFGQVKTAEGAFVEESERSGEDLEG